MDYRKQKPGRVQHSLGSSKGEQNFSPVSTYSAGTTHSSYQNQSQQYTNNLQDNNADKMRRNNLTNYAYAHPQHQQTQHQPELQNYQSYNNSQLDSSVNEFQNLSLNSDMYGQQQRFNERSNLDNNSSNTSFRIDSGVNGNAYATDALAQGGANQHLNDTSSMYNPAYQQTSSVYNRPTSTFPSNNGQGGSNYSEMPSPQISYQHQQQQQHQYGGLPNVNHNLPASPNQNGPYTSPPVGSPVNALPSNQLYSNAPVQYPSPLMNVPNQKSSSAGFSDNMPNPINEQRLLDEKYKEATISYQQYAEPPPTSQTQFYYKDEGISNPRYIQSTYYVVPSTGKIAKNTKIPLGIVVQPFAPLPYQDTQLLASQQGSQGPLRCEQCRGYLNSQSIFINGGKTFICNLCGHKTNVTDSYFCYLDSTGVRLDKFSRPELCRGSYEMSTNNLYCRNNVLPKPPIYIFMFNVSRSSITNGMISVVADILSTIIPKHLPQDVHYIDQSSAPMSGAGGAYSPSANTPHYPTNTPINGTNNSNPQNVDPSRLLVRVAFMAYDKRIYFFNVRDHSDGTTGKQQVEICIDVNEPYIPSYKGFIVDALDCASQIQSLLQDLPKIFSNSTVVETMLGPVIESAVSLLKSNGDCGRLFVFHSMLPNSEFPGKLENRDNNAVFCTENELSVLKPNGNYYSQLAEKCVASGVSVNLFLTTSGYVDVATLGNLCEITGGRIFYYPFFDTKRSGQQLAYDVQSFLARPCAHDAYMKLRVSSGLRVSAMHGCMSLASATDIQIAYIDSDTTVAFELEHDEDLKPGTVVSCQLAVLYTASSGQRRLRVHNIYLRHASDYTEIYRSIDCEASVCLLTKKYCMEMMNQKSVTFVGDKLGEFTYQPLLSYIKNCKQSQSHFQQLVLPESLKLYPLYMNSLIKSDAFLSRKELGQDGRSIAIIRLKSASIAEMLLELYPAIYNIFDPVNNGTMEELTQKTNSLSELGIQTYRCSYEKLAHDQIYLMVLPHIIFLWVGKAIDQECFRCLFGVNSIDQIDGVVMETLPAFDNQLSNCTRLLINLVRKHHHPNRFIPVTVVKQSGVSENAFRHFMAESKSSKPKSFTYMEFLCFLHKSINENL